MIEEPARLCDWLTEMANGEPIEAVVIGAIGGDDWALDDNEAGEGYIPGYSEQPRGVVLTWEEALPHISYVFDRGFGEGTCNGVYAWTRSRVIGISMYDGSTRPFWVPRHPQPGEVAMPGGGY